MSSVKCNIEGCAYKNRKGYCRKKTITLQPNDNELNEMYCLGWNSPEQALFDKIMRGDTEPG